MKKTGWLIAIVIAIVIVFCTAQLTSMKFLDPLNFDVTKDHVYSVDRTEKELIFYVDGEETWRYANMYLNDEETRLQYPFSKYTFDVILNFSLGGLLNGNPTWPGEIHDEDLPGEMWVDWVKVSEL